MGQGGDSEEATTAVQVRNDGSSDKEDGNREGDRKVE